jgi:hypothetical protein
MVELRFGFFSRDLPELCDLLDSFGLSYSFYRKDRGMSIMKVQLGGMLGSAGRAFDIGYKLAKVEKRVAFDVKPRRRKKVY